MFLRLNFKYLVVAICLIVNTSCASSDITNSKASEVVGYDKGFDVFIVKLKKDLRKANIPIELLDKELGKNPQPDASVIKKLHHQPESTMTFEEYHNRIVSKDRVKKGRKNFKANRKDLMAKSKQYKIPAETIVALWGVETAYGKLAGNNSIVRSLATLAYKSHRKEFFRNELIKSLKIVRDGHIKLENLKGSWAGAMGQCQFMPSSFYSFAQDGDGDGKKDIWNTKSDVFASAANYLAKSGWKNNEAWGQRVILGKNLPKTKFSERGLSEHRKISEWEKLGVYAQKNGFRIKNKKRKGRLFLPEGTSGKAYMVYNNFDVILKWNNSSYFAFSVLDLSDKVAL